MVGSDLLLTGGLVHTLVDLLFHPPHYKFGSLGL